jgi:hypothetical protein
MTSSDRKRLMRSGAASAGFWALLLVLAIVVPVTRPDANARLPAVRIELAADTPVPAPAPAKPAPREIPSALPSPAAPDAPATPSPSPSRKKLAAPRKDSVPPSSGGLGIPNFASPVAPSGRTAASGSTLEFASDASVPLASGSSSGIPEFEGTAAKVERKAESGLRGASSGTRDSSGAPSDDTSNALAAVASGAAVSPDGDSRPSEASRPGDVSRARNPSPVTAPASVSGALSFEGGSRKLLYPAVPAVSLPDRLARLVNSDRSVTIRFTVLADGSVPAALVEFSPQAILPPEIRDWLRKEFSGWRFEKAVADGQARFLYSIRVE